MCQKFLIQGVLPCIFSSRESNLNCDYGSIPKSEEYSNLTTRCVIFVQFLSNFLLRFELLTI